MRDALLRSFQVGVIYGAILCGAYGISNDNTLFVVIGAGLFGAFSWR